MPFVYALCDPATMEPRYVGKANDPEVRLGEHLQDAEQGGETHKCNWLRKLGIPPVLRILEILRTQKQANLAEIRWMNLLRHWGARLTNGREGGHGGSPGLEARRKISLTLQGRSSPNKGNVYTPEQRARMSVAFRGERNPFFGKRHSERSKALIRAARAKQVFSSETREKISLAMRGVGNPMWGQTHSEKARLKISKAQSGRIPPMLGKKHSKEARQRMSASRLAMLRRVA